MDCKSAGQGRILITGAAGFIGYHLADHLLSKNYTIYGIDSFNSSYGNELNHLRSAELLRKYEFEVHKLDLSITSPTLLSKNLGRFDIIVHLAAWPGVRYSYERPLDYFLNNVSAFNNVIEYARITKVAKMLYASSSSVYGDLGSSGPVLESQATGNNLKSYYATTKWINELTARSYRNAYELNATALRFFTVFGEFGRPDMAYWKFAENLLNSRQILLYGADGGTRNFTYIGDVTKILENLLNSDFNAESLNIASGPTFQTINMLDMLSESLGISKRHIEITERPAFDVEKTWADVSLLNSIDANIKPTPIRDGLDRFSKWYLDYVENA